MEEIKKLVSPYFVDWQTEVEITAVLKYMLFEYSFSSMDLTLNWFIVFTINWKDVFIPNKPLHLYTEQEEKDLLELLLKLK